MLIIIFILKSMVLLNLYVWLTISCKRCNKVFRFNFWKKFILTRTIAQMQKKFQNNNQWLKNRETTDKFSDPVFSHVSHQAVSDAMDHDGGAVG